MPASPEHFAQIELLTFAEICAALTYFEDHSDELAEVLAEDVRQEARTEEARRDRIKRHFMGEA